MPKSTTEQRKPRTGATTPELDSLSCQPMHPICRFIPWCAGAGKRVGVGRGRNRRVNCCFSYLGVPAGKVCPGLARRSGMDGSRRATGVLVSTCRRQGALEWKESRGIRTRHSWRYTGRYSKSVGICRNPWSREAGIAGGVPSGGTRTRWVTCGNPRREGNGDGGGKANWGGSTSGCEGGVAREGSVGGTLPSRRGGVGQDRHTIGHASLARQW